MSQIKDIFFIKTILDRATAGSHNGETGYYNVSDNMFSEGHSCYCDNGNDYYSDLKGIFDCSSTLSGTYWSSNDQIEFDAGHYSMTIVKMAANNYLSILVDGQNVSLNYDGNYYYTQNNYCNYGGTWHRWDYINGELVYIKTYYGGSYAVVDENVETTLYSSAPIMMYYSNADRNVNYARIDGDQGIGPGGWQVPNPNPTRKIVLNGVNYSDTSSEDPNYNWYYNDDKTLIVRESKADGSFRWYFDNFYVSSTAMSVPSNLTKFIKNGVIVWGYSPDPSDASSHYVKVGFYDNTIRLWTSGLSYNLTGHITSIMESTDTGTNMEHEWEKPNIPLRNRIYLNGIEPRKIILNSNLFYEAAPNYEWYYNEDKTLVVRKKIADNTFRWYFNHCYITNSNPFLPVPNDMTQFVKHNVLVNCDVYTDSECTILSNPSSGKVGFYDNAIRLWTNSLTAYLSGYVKMIMESTDTGQSNIHTWEEPTFDPYNG